MDKLDAVISAEALKTLTARFMGEDCEADAGTIHERMFRTILRDFIGKADLIDNLYLVYDRMDFFVMRP